MRHHPLAECEICPLYKPDEDIAVFGDGPEEEDVDVVIVGEAPGVHEVWKKRPFIGESGKLLDKILKLNNLHRDDVWVTNACLCRPDNNKTPTKKAIEACKPRLMEEIKQLNPKTIILAGGVPTKAFFGHSENITRARVGPPKKHDEFPKVDVIPTFHPAYALRNTNRFPDIMEDFKKIKFTPKEWIVPEYKVINNVKDACLLLGGIRNQIVAVDIETDYDKDNPNFQHPTEQRVTCLGLTVSGSKVYVLGKQVFKDPISLNLHKSVVGFLRENKIVYHNAKFDISVLSNQFDIHEAYFDTMLAMYCLDEGKGKGGYALGNMAIELLNAPEWKSMIADDDSDETLYEYNAYDVANTYRLFELLSEELVKEDLTHLHEFLLRSTYTLMDIELLGIGIDQEYQKEIYAETEVETETLLRGLREITGKLDYNPRSWQQTQYALIYRFNVPFTKVPDTREDTISNIRDYAESIADRSLWTFCDRLLRYKKAYKLKSVYIEGINKRLFNGRVHTSYFLHGTKTGRLSSGRPNLQNIPRNKIIKKQFVPPHEGKLFAQADYKQAEFRAVAYLAQDPLLQDILRDPSRDIHGEVAMNIFGKNFTPEQRFAAKQIVFGVTYGMEAFRLSMILDISPEDAEEYIYKWWKMFPATESWVKSVKKKIDTEQELQTSFGHKSRFPLLTRENKWKLYKEGTAFLPQSLASNFCLEAANRLNREGFDTEILGLVHDAILFQTGKSLKMVDRVKEVMEQTGEEYLEGFVPTPVDIEVGPNWGSLQPQMELL